MSRQPNRRPSIYEGADGWFHTYVTVGQKPDGKLDRRHIRGKTKAAVKEKLDALNRQLDQGHVPQLGASPTLGQWMEHWLTVIAARKVRPSTLEGYTSKVHYRIVPGLGKHRLDKLRPEHVEAFYAALEAEVSPATALQVHRILSRALKVAVQRGKLSRNPCALVDAPSAERVEVEPIDPGDARKVLAAAAERRNAARWWVALAIGLRQGEALGLRWVDVNLDADPPTLAVRQALQRRVWKHGCDGCGKPARSCPQRTGGGLAFDVPKSRKSRRVIPLPEPLAKVLREHRAAQVQERLIAGKEWEDHGLVFAQWNGRPINPRSDWGEWKELLSTAGAPNHRLHDARHYAATFMFEQGLEGREVMELLGHSQISLTLGTYTHVRAKILRQATDRLAAGLEQLQPDGATTRHLRRVK